MAKPDSIASALARGSVQLRALQTGRRDAELLLMQVMGCDRAYLLTHPEAELTPEQAAAYENWIARRSRNEPVQYITGEQEFFGLKLGVTPAVLIPRPETEHLVEAALTRADHSTGLKIADVGTGSGAIAVALANALPRAQVTALDISPAALAVARENAERHGVAERIEFVESDLLGAVAGESFDLIVSNPPYVAECEVLELQVRDFEPWIALYGGVEGLDVYRRLVPIAHKALKSRGWLLMEMGHDQRDALAEMLASWSKLSFINDLQGIPRVACAQRHNG
ncbi:MAG: peptide chain release factor N(5)-glutamine methyltransferase [Silvibacterium sp.]|nr:peptide chain release factor N(5)-glutamine methyltransferase [Silvibacterium sp.]